VAVTRANVEAILVQRAGPLMTKAGMATTIVGTNANLNDPIGWGVRQAGGTVAVYSLVTDADLATVDSADTDKMLDFAELRLLKNILTNISLVDTQVGSRRESLSQLARQLENRIKTFTEELEDTYGLSVPSLEAGFIGVEFAEHYETSEDEVL
jgi:hypothetical protein